MEKLSSLNVQWSECLSLDMRLERFERFGFAEAGGCGRKPRTSLSERLLEREGPRRSEGRVIINRVALGLARSGGVDNELSDSSDSVLLEDE